MNKLFLDKQVPLQARCMLTMKEKYLQKKYRPVGVFLNVNALTQLKFKLRLKFRNDNYSSITVNFHASLH